MKTIAYAFCFCLASMEAIGQNENKPLPSSALTVNTLGLLQFGPVFQGEFRLGQSKSYIGPSVRLPYLGLLYHLIVSDGFVDTVKPAALGIGLQYKYLVPKTKGAWYVGLAGYYSFGSASGGNMYDSWEGKFANVTAMVNAGWRWRNPSKKIFIGLGILLGPSIDVLDERTYSSGYTDYYKQNYFFGMGEFVIGWEKVK